MIKKINIIVLIFLALLSFAQTKEEIVARINADRDNLRSIKTKYSNLLINEKYLIYDKNDNAGKSYYIKSKYDSLTRKGLSDSAVLDNSILKVYVTPDEYYIMKSSSYSYFYKYRNGKLLSIELLESFPEYETYDKKDLINKVNYRACNNNLKKCTEKFTYDKYREVKSNNEFDKNIYSFSIDNNDNFKEQFYDKDFPMSEENIYKIFLKKFNEQGVALMKDKSFTAIVGTSKNFDKNDLKDMLESFKRLISEREKSDSGFYDKDAYSYWKARNGTSISKQYDDKNKAYYKLIMSANTTWKFKINPVTGDLENIELIPYPEN